MKHCSGLVALLAVVAAALIGAQAAGAGDAHGGKGVVFVQTNQPAGNQIVVYDQAGDGTLSPAGTYATGGNGGAALPGTESDHLASQGSLAYDAEHQQLIAVNAGSDKVSAFRVKGDRLELENVLASGGQFPASVGVHDDLAYVLNSGGTGIVQGFRIGQHGLEAIPSSARSLGLGNTDPPNFLSAPGQVGFTPDGSKLIVTTKASTSSIDVFQVENDGLLSGTPFVLMVNVDLPVQSVPDLLAYAKANPDKMVFASAGPGVPHHLFMELFMSMTGMKASHVPYRGSLPALNDLVAGHIPMMFSDLGPATGLLEAKRVRPLGISTKTRHPSFPDIPPLGDAVPGYEAVSWQAMAAPARTPRPVLDKLNAELTAVLAMPEVKEQTLKYGFLPLENRSIDELKEFVKAEIVRWGNVVRDAGLAGTQ